MNQSRPKTLGRALVRLGLAALDLYALLIFTYLVLQAFTGNRLWLVAAMSTFSHLFLLPAVVLLPLMLWLRRWPVVAMLMAGGLAFGWRFGPLLLPPQIESYPDAPTLTVMTANLGVAYDAPVEKLTGVLEASGADIIALQELSDVQQAAIEQKLSILYPYQVLYGEPVGDVTGKGLLSKYPIVEASEPFTLRLPNGNTHMRAVIDVDGHSLTVVIAHPPPPKFEGEYDVPPDVVREVKALVDMAMGEGAALLMGDFNATDQNDRYDLVREAGLSDAFRAAGWGFGATWPVHRGVKLLPLVRIDYIWYTSHFRAVEAWVGPETGADHLPVLARLVWEGA